MTKNFASLVMVVTSLSLALGHSNLYAADVETSYDHLIKTESEQVDELYLKQGIDFSNYNKIMLAKTEVSFRKNAYRSQVSSRHSIKKAMANVTPKLQALFDQTFSNVITEKGDYSFTSDKGEQTLEVIPKLTNVYLAALDEMGSTSSTHTYAESAGDMTLVLEVYDSISGEMLARIIDHKEATDWGRLVRQTSVDMNQQAKRMFKGWADDLNNTLQVSTKK